MQHADAWHLVDGVYQEALDHGLTCAERWSQDGDHDGHFTGHVDLGKAGHLTWDSDRGWTHHARDSSTTEIAEAHADPSEVILALDLDTNLELMTKHVPEIFTVEWVRSAIASATIVYGTEVVLTDAQANQLKEAVNKAVCKFTEDVPAPDDLEEEIWFAASEVGVSGPALAQFISDIRADL